MKKITKIAGVLMALCAMGSLFASGKKNKQKDVFKVGVLSYLNFSEEEVTSFFKGREKLDKILEKQGYLTVSEKVRKKDKFMNRIEPEVKFYDTLDALLMALKSGEIELVRLPNTTANYIIAKDDKIGSGFHYDFEKLNSIRRQGSFVDEAFSRLSDGFSFMMLEKNKALCEQFNSVIKEMSKDGSMKKLIDEQIVLAMDGRALKAMLPENKTGRETIKVAVTGDLPPMDYIAADGTFAGFNTALLYEIGKRLDKNIQLVQVSNLGRASALASGTVDVVFWTRSSAFSRAKDMTPEEFQAFKNEQKAKSTKEENEAMQALSKALGSKNGDDREIRARKDMPDGTIVTVSYFDDMPVSIVLKKSKKKAMW